MGEILDDNYKFSISGVYYAPKESKSAGAEGASEGDMFKEIANGIEERLPKRPYDVEMAQRKYPPAYMESMNVMLVQEIIRFNRLFVRIRSTVVVTDLLRRFNMIDLWLAKGPPVSFWISGFFFTQAFLTGVLQNMARRDKVAIDECIWNYYIQGMETLEGCEADQYDNAYTKPEKGCYVYGLYMEGARWDCDSKVIAESKPKVLFDQTPVIYLDPIAKVDDKTPALHYPCPVYKTSERRGVLSTTGHSTNFIMMMLVPISAEQSEKYWVRRGVAMLSQLDE